jgi:glycosyltransferase involved in cell wall biosynthesis
LAALARQHAPSAPIALIPNGVNVDEFSPPTRTRPANPPRLLFVGRLARQKGVRYLLEALRSAGSRPLLRIVGDGPDRPELERFIAEHGLSDRVEIVGWLAREQLPAQYDWGDIFVLPSLDEGMPNVVLEAQAAGMPVIATDVPGSRDLVTTGVDGLLVPPEDARSLAFAIETLCHEPARLRAYGQQSREAALARRWEQIADRYRTALLGACGRGSTAAASNDAVMSW